MDWYIIGLAAMGVLVFCLAVTRVRGARDEEGRRLKPTTTAILAYSFIHLVAFIGLAAALDWIFASTAFLHDLFQSPISVSDTAPPEMREAVDKLSSPMLVFLLFLISEQFAPLRALDEHLQRWLFETSHRSDDHRLLETCLIGNAFMPSDYERQRNLETLQEHQIFLADSDTRFIDGTTNNLWRKVSTLLRLLERWGEEGERNFSKTEEAELLDVVRTHRRKTRHAMNLLRMMLRVRQGEGAGRPDVAGAARVLQGRDPAEPTWSGLPQGADAPEETGGAVARAAIPASEGTSAYAPVKLENADLEGHPGEVAQRPIVLSSFEFAQVLRDIQGYFSIEYQILLKRTAKLAARAVIFSGDAAPKRFDDVKSSGFQGLGYLEPFSFHWILWAFLFIGLGTFMIVFGVSQVLFPLLNPGSTNCTPLRIFVSIPLPIAFATLAGAMVGSNRKLARETRETPWGGFLLAGVGTLFIWTLVQHIAFQIIPAPGPECAASGRPQATGVADIWPFAIVSLAATLGVARLSRVRYAWTAAQTRGARLRSKAADMALMAAVMVCAAGVAVAVHQIVGTPIGRSFQEDPSMLRFAVIGAFAGMIGLLVGTVIDDVRRAARSEIALTPDVARDILAAQKVLPETATPRGV